MVRIIILFECSKAVSAIFFFFFIEDNLYVSTSKKVKYKRCIKEGGMFCTVN